MALVPETFRCVYQLDNKSAQISGRLSWYTRVTDEVEVKEATTRTSYCMFQVFFFSCSHLFADISHPVASVLTLDKKGIRSTSSSKPGSTPVFFLVRQTLHGHRVKLQSAWWETYTEGLAGCSYPQLSSSGIWRLNIPALFCLTFPFVSIPVFLSVLNSANRNQRPPPRFRLSRIVLLFPCICAPVCCFSPPDGLIVKRPVDFNSTITERSVKFSPFSDPRSSLRLRGNRERNVLVVAEMLAFFGST